LWQCFSANYCNDAHLTKLLFLKGFINRCCNNNRDFTGGFRIFAVKIVSGWIYLFFLTILRLGPGVTKKSGQERLPLPNAFGTGLFCRGALMGIGTTGF